MQTIIDSLELILCNLGTKCKQIQYLLSIANYLVSNLGLGLREMKQLGGKSYRELEKGHDFESQFRERAAEVRPKNWT